MVLEGRLSWVCQSPTNGKWFSHERSRGPTQLKSHISVEIENQAENTYVRIIMLKLGRLSLFVFGICDQKRQLDFEISYASEVWIGSLVRVNLHFT